jgi:hypothetical protein
MSRSPLTRVGRRPTRIRQLFLIGLALAAGVSVLA